MPGATPIEGGVLTPPSWQFLATAISTYLCAEHQLKSLEPTRQSEVMCCMYLVVFPCQDAPIAKLVTLL